MNIEGYRILFKVGKGAVVDSFTGFGVVLLDMPKNIPLVQKKFSQQWFDENGDEDYVPRSIKYEAAKCNFTFEVKDEAFEPDVYDKASKFLAYLQSGVFSFYSEYAKIGRGNVVFESSDDNAKFSTMESANGKKLQLLRFTVTFKINDPYTQVKLSL